ncbi:MAG: methyltransferase domain-containing protein [Bacteroidia bacterium]
MRRLVRRLYYWPIDFYEGIIGKRDALTPPKGKIFIGPGDFKTIGEKLKYDFIHYGGLKHGHHVLDIGCGIGRIAIPLTSYIDKTGSYNGFDVVKEGIEWCQKKISPQYSNFTFKHVNLHNDLYNIEDAESASEFIFPYEDESFDFVILTSVFTHMQAKEVENYLKEISRVMKKEAICFATFFIIDQESNEYLKKSAQPFFPFEYDNYFLHDENVKDANIAYKIEFLEQLLSQTELKIDSKHPGWWAGREKLDCVDFQDVLLLKK